MLRELRKKMEEFHMVSPGELVLAGVSGGADSVCLLLALLGLREQLQFSLEVIHVEHGIRGEESRQDAEYVKELCEQYQVICHEVSVDVPAYCAQTGLGVEEAARVLRYQVFSRFAMEKGAKIALAHHMEDNAETILFQMVRGSSLSGLCGMQPVRKDENGVCYMRPLLFFRRADVEDFLRTQGVTWRVDSTNAQLEYSRNFLRGNVIPELQKVNAQAVEHMNQTAEHLSEIRDYLDFETEKAWKMLVQIEEKLRLDAKGLLELHPVLQRQIAYKAIVCMAKQKKDITSAHVGDFLALCKGQSGKRISLPYGMTAWKEFEIVYIAVLENSVSNDGSWNEVYEVSEEMLKELLLSGKERTISFGTHGENIRCRVFKNNEELVEIPRKTYTKWLDYDKIKKGFCIRTRRSGDYFISDTTGHRKKLKTYFVDEKIPVAERGKRWLFAQDNEVLWLIGGRISEHIKVSQRTNFIIEIMYEGGNTGE